MRIRPHASARRTALRSRCTLARAAVAAFLSLGWAVEAEVDEVAPPDTVQIALFHPGAKRSIYDASEQARPRGHGPCVVGARAPPSQPSPSERSPPQADPADYVQRAPFPTIHLLRTADVRAVADGSAAAIAAGLPARNAQRMSEHGVTVLETEFARLRSGDEQL